MKDRLSILGEDWKKVEELIASSLASDIKLLDDLNASLLENSGKKLRPMLSLLMAKACGKVTQDSIKFAAASELLHNATLLHDDVADQSATRRGKPTVFSILGGTASVLVGDFWLVRAMETILSAENERDEAISLFSKTLNNLAEGEMLQLEKAESADTTEADYLRIIYNKTATLFESACVTAAVSACADDVLRQAAGDYAVNLGLAFQIKDDIFDYNGSDIGKPVGVDIREHKITMPLLGAFVNAGAEKEAEVRARVAALDAGDEDGAAEIIEFARENGGIEYAEKRLEDFRQLAVDALSPLAESEAKQCLIELAAYAAGRNK